ncbi:MAG: hypothetical protein PVI99_07410 [Anaerolineales bacterium]
MISTITTSTISTITTAGLAGSFAFIGVVVLLALLIQKEVASGSASPRLKRLSKVLNISIVPMLIAFILIVIFRVSEVLN